MGKGLRYCRQVFLYFLDGRWWFRVENGFEIFGLSRRREVNIFGFDGWDSRRQSPVNQYIWENRLCTSMHDTNTMQALQSISDGSNDALNSMDRETLVTRIMLKCSDGGAHRIQNKTKVWSSCSFLRELVMIRWKPKTRIKVVHDLQNGEFHCLRMFWGGDSINFDSKVIFSVPDEPYGWSRTIPKLADDLESATVEFLVDCGGVVASALGGGKI